VASTAVTGEDMRVTLVEGTASTKVLAVLSHCHIASSLSLMSSNPLLWSHLRPSTRPAASLSSLPLVPENKTNTSLRVVLHDTKSALEQVGFSSHSHQYEKKQQRPPSLSVL
jgi:hypothetical protein